MANIDARITESLQHRLETLEARMFLCATMFEGGPDFNGGGVTIGPESSDPAYIQDISQYIDYADQGDLWWDPTFTDNMSDADRAAYDQWVNQWQSWVDDGSTDWTQFDALPGGDGTDANMYDFGGGWTDANGDWQYTDGSDGQWTDGNMYDFGGGWVDDNGDWQYTDGSDGQRTDGGVYDFGDGQTYNGDYGSAADGGQSDWQYSGDDGQIGDGSEYMMYSLAGSGPIRYNFRGQTDGDATAILPVDVQNAQIDTPAQPGVDATIEPAMFKFDGAGSAQNEVTIAPAADNAATPILAQPTVVFTPSKFEDVSVSDPAADSNRPEHAAVPSVFETIIDSASTPAHAAALPSILGL